MTAEQPQKIYYSISEVAEITQIKPHVLRYWEAEFPTLKPKKNRAGNRSYRQADIEEVLAIKKLLYQEGYKIDGARRILKDSVAREEVLEAASNDGGLPVARLLQLRQGLEELLEMVRRL